MELLGEVGEVEDEFLLFAAGKVEVLRAQEVDDVFTRAQRI